MELKLMKTQKLTPLAQWLIIAKLNHCFKGNHLSMQEIADLFKVERISIRRAAEQLEEHGFAHRVRGKGVDMHKVYLDWDKGKVQLWEAAIKYMKPPCVRHYHVKTPANMELFTPGGLHLLSERTTHKKIDGKPHLVYKGFSQSRKRNEALIERVRPSEADYVVEFWSYPPILPGRDEMDNLSLYLSTDATGDKDMEMNHALILTTFDWDGHGHYSPRRFRRTPLSGIFGR